MTCASLFRDLPQIGKSRYSFIDLNVQMFAPQFGFGVSRMREWLYYPQRCPQQQDPAHALPPKIQTGVARSVGRSYPLPLQMGVADRCWSYFVQSSCYHGVTHEHFVSKSRRSQETKLPRSEWVGEGGLEPPPRCRDRNLNPARLPDFATRPWVRHGNNRLGRRSQVGGPPTEPPERPSVRNGTTSR